MNWPITCTNCNTTYQSETDDGLRTRKAQYKHGRIFKEYICYSCVNPEYLSNSDIIKHLHIARGKVKEQTEGLIAAEQVDKRWLD